jgi:hypothetical protein
MTWGTVICSGSTHTHYYLGTTSICLDNALAENDSVKYAVFSSKHCAKCKTILKSKKVQKVTSRAQRAMDIHQNYSDDTFGVSLEDMLCNWLEFHSKTSQITLEQFKEFLSEQYRYISSGAILISLLAANKIVISQNHIIPNPVEVPHV